MMVIAVISLIPDPDVASISVYRQLNNKKNSLEQTISTRNKKRVAMMTDPEYCQKIGTTTYFLNLLNRPQISKQNE